MNYQSFITSVLQEASEIANEKFGKVTSSIKENSNSVVTEADFAVGKHIINRIKNIYPQYNIIDEETGAVNNGSAFTWVIDPIDGTSNFANNVPTYGIMLGLLHKEKPIAGGAALPFFKDICTAEKGMGTFYNNEKISVSTEKKLLNTLVAYGIDSHQENPKNTYEEIKHLSEIILAIRNLRTSNCVFDILLTAKGSYGGVLNRTSKIWDNVAQQIIIEESGGLYTDFFGKPMDYSNSLTSLSKNYTYCAASPILHKQLQDIIHSK